MIFAGRALLTEGWVDRVRITVADGQIASVAKASAPLSGDTRVSGAVQPAQPRVSARYGGHDRTPHCGQRKFLDKARSDVPFHGPATRHCTSARRGPLAGDNSARGRMCRRRNSHRRPPGLGRAPARRAHQRPARSTGAGRGLIVVAGVIGGQKPQILRLLRVKRPGR